MTELRRFCAALDLRDDPALIGRYRDWHRPGGPPAAVTRSLRAAHIRTLEIYLCGTRLFMVMDVGPDYDPARRAASDAKNPDVVAWEDLMWTFQQPLPGAAPGAKWVPAERIYALADQPD